MIRVLHITGNLSFAGLEAVVMNYYRHMDISKVQFDFVVGSMNKQLYDDEILERGGDLQNSGTQSEYRWIYKKTEKNHRTKSVSDCSYTSQ